MVELRSNERLVEVHWLIENDRGDDETGVFRFAADDSVPAGGEEAVIRLGAAEYFAANPTRYKPNWGDAALIPDGHWRRFGLRNLGDFAAVRIEVYHDEELG